MSTVYFNNLFYHGLYHNDIMYRVHGDPRYETLTCSPPYCTTAFQMHRGTLLCIVRNAPLAGRIQRWYFIIYYTPSGLRWVFMYIYLLYNFVIIIQFNFFFFITYKECVCMKNIKYLFRDIILNGHFSFRRIF